jgi:1-deoxy-D-xylulose-5-phosphate reductoisomerase
VAVAAFLENRIGFTDIPAVVEHALSAIPSLPIECLEHLVHIDAEARVRAAERVGTPSSARGDRFS